MLKEVTLVAKITNVNKGFVFNILYIVIVIFVIALFILFFFLETTGYLYWLGYSIGNFLSPG